VAMTLDIGIRPIQRADVPRILLLAERLGEWFTPEGLAQMAHDLEHPQGYVAVQGDRVLGFVTWSPVDESTATLSWIGVAPDHRRRGIGRSLLAALVECLRDKGIRSLEVDTVADNVEYEPYAETRRFYRAMGFQDVRVDEKFWGEGNDRYDRLVMRKDLTR